jgi:ATP-dependent protease ClpP protease subunit
MSMFDFQMSADGESAEVMLYGPIGSTFFEEGITAKTVGEALAKVPNAKNLTVRLNSPGGSVWEGMTIRNQLAQHPARVTAEVEGLAASCASVIAMAADEIRMHAGSRMMVHEAKKQTFGDAREHQRAVAQMISINSGAADIYVARTGLSKDEIVKMMAEETWLTPEEALAKGFADKVVAAKGGAPRMFLGDLARYGYQNVPAQLMAAEKERGPFRPPVKGEDMSFARIAMALGLSGEGAEEAAVMAAIDRLKNERQRGESVLSELRHITGKDTHDAVLGAVRGLADAAKQLTAAQAQNAQLVDQLEGQERAALIAADAANPKGRRLSPAVAKLFDNKPVAELKAYLEVAQPIAGTAAPTGGTQPSLGSTNGAAGSGVSQQGDIVLFDGRKWEDMQPYEQHNLHVENIDAYKALRQNFEQRKRA